MPALVFDTCCGCIELRSGCLIIAYLNLIAEIIMIVLGFVTLLTGGVLVSENSNAETKDLGTALLAVGVVYLIIVFIFLAFTIVLLVGLHQSKRGHVKAYLVYGCIFIVLLIILFCVSLGGTVSVGGIIQNVLTILLSIYFLLVIRSYYYKMDDKRPTTYNTA